ncbi:PfkB family carbohydrate kinase [Amnibacterium sp. CER49]|uniref:PfkB family carbohydrate kinase n=1 Tax=Amnibacterium sp. CER49 TaxID=3039161 RepID=UPI002446CD2D|nr:PfkB family carbohydrate kinase [Amnibacterium sp. CER49]MDH2443136.1 PfkB family carbohydrate kinase [Amnibacterium sp. CER49]
MPTVWVLGSLNVDAIVRVERHPQPGETVLGGPVDIRFGGKGANQAVAAAGAGATVRMIGRVGDDADGRAYLDSLRRHGVDVRDVRVDPRTATGRAAIAVDAGGENTIIVSPGANAAVDTTDLEPLDAVAPGDVLLLQLEVDLAVVAEAAKRVSARQGRVVLNVAPYAALPPDVLDLGDPVVANESEAAALAAAGATPGELLVTRGGAGSSWGELRVAADRVADVVDTTGAGDTYCGALAAALARGEDREPAMREASAAAARSVTWSGAQPDPGNRV